MTIAYPALMKTFDTCTDGINTLIVENQHFLSCLLQDIINGLDGCPCSFAVFENDKQLKTDKAVELLSQFFPFDINKKTLINKITSELEKRALSGEYYNRSMEIIADIERLILSLSIDFSCELNYNKLDIGSVIKSSGISINDRSTSLAEKIIDYMELVTEFEKNKLFVTLNLRSFIPDEDILLFMNTVIGHGYNLFMIENCEHPLLPCEKRYIVDSDMCEIS